MAPYGCISYYCTAMSWLRYKAEGSTEQISAVAVIFCGGCIWLQWATSSHEDSLQVGERHFYTQGQRRSRSGRNDSQAEAYMYHKRAKQRMMQTTCIALGQTVRCFVYAAAHSKCLRNAIVLLRCLILFICNAWSLRYLSRCAVCLRCLVRDV